LILLDEPLSSLDASLREGLRRELRLILKGSKIPVIHVTHDQMEAISIADRMGFLLKGRIFEEGTPEEMFLRPGKLETARFMGIKNIFRVRRSRGNMLETEIGDLHWEGNIPKYIGFRSHSVSLVDDNSGIEGTVLGMEYLGDRTMVQVDIDGKRVEVQYNGESVCRIGDPISIFLNDKDLIALDR
jgi:ABC-type Fe3+/spermidine/putrescine transport system ATPase subunit